eukprot:TRINITY_DN7223_c0_g1_i1.p2 TRINITY_DN7223_c0_g1~~TRINITY_DN7223_c0_g1_i1.p2  ORF type:complete len:56 (+),score=20.01 TRINITY_DN7223_c0_g1_i1:451-618(+)
MPGVIKGFNSDDKLYLIDFGNHHHSKCGYEKILMGNTKEYAQVGRSSETAKAHRG